MSKVMTPELYQLAIGRLVKMWHRTESKKDFLNWIFPDADHVEVTRVFNEAVASGEWPLDGPIWDFTEETK